MFAAGKTAAVSGAAPDDKFNYVTMLLHGDGTNGAQNNTFLDSSTNNFSITRNGNTTQGSFSPYGSNWSNYFVRASTQYLTVSNAGGQFSFGTGAFTIECWVNLASMPSGTGYPTSYWLFGGGPVDSDAGIDFYINNTQIGFNLTTFSSPTAIGNHGMSVGAWYHVAVVRGGGSNQTVSIYVNGTRVATASSVTATANAATTGIAISAAEPLGATNGNFNGYISNHRVVKGTAVYDPTQSTLTVPTTPLTAVTNTSLLTCQANRFFDASTNALTITVNGTPSVQRFNPFGASTAYSTSVIGGSGYFDGDGDYLTVADNAAFEFGSGNFTIEAWMYTTASGIHTLCSKANSADNSEYEIYLYNGAVQAYVSNGTSWQVTMATSAIIKVNEWNHIAVTRNGSSWNIWVNGVSQASATASFTINDSSLALGIGAFPDSGFATTGYMCDFRMVKGTAVYTSAFTPPTAPLTAISGTSILNNFTNAAIYDNAMMNDLETVGNAQISTSVKKYGTGSLAFDGSGDYLAAPQTVNTDFGTGDFTVEFWANWASASSSSTLVCKWGLGSSNQYAWLINYNTSGNLWFYTGDSGSPGSLFTFGFTPTTSTWYHIAFTRSGSSLRCFVNGTQAGSTETTTSNMSAVQGTFVGNNPNSSTYFNGYIDDLRITKGYARYTANFTAPTATFSDTGPY